MIHYHGGPINPQEAAIETWSGKHAMVSFANPGSIGLVSEVCQSFALDNGAFTIWKQGGKLDIGAYADWVAQWRRHPGFDWALIPDVIDGTESENDAMIQKWLIRCGGNLLNDVPVWHMNESIERLKRFCRSWRRVAIGSAGEFAQIGTREWWGRMDDAMDAICDGEGRPPAKMHGLRMLDPEVFGALPLSSADSSNVARNIGIDSKWQGPYQPPTRAARAAVMVSRIESVNSAAQYRRQDRQRVGLFDEVGI